MAVEVEGGLEDGAGADFSSLPAVAPPAGDEDEEGAVVLSDCILSWSVAMRAWRASAVVIDGTGVGVGVGVGVADGNVDAVVTAASPTETACLLSAEAVAVAVAVDGGSSVAVAIDATGNVGIEGAAVVEACKMATARWSRPIL